MSRFWMCAFFMFLSEGMEYRVKQRGSMASH